MIDRSDSASFMRPDALQYREATEADLPALLDLVHRAFRGDASRVGWTTEADLLDGQRTDPEGIRALISAPASRVVLVEWQSRLVACAHIQARQQTGYFGMFSVDPAQQNNGLGKQILAECERQLATDLHCTRVEMTVIKQREELIAWYLRRGYLCTGESRPFPYGDPRYGLPRTDQLEFIVMAKQLGQGDAATASVA